ncbi:MAG: hypothetical protein ACFFF9_11690, partial [Candidatus Thorarchaeota archaeon]
GKEVDFKVFSQWTGCGHPSQDFTIIRSQSYQAFSERIILASQTRIPYIHLYPAHSVWHHIKTALVYNIFEPEKNIQRRSDIRTPTIK